ncbi:hypothetical protein RJ639_014688 [Escallonia herrerae]|uniref:Uncharacterized protein n=1 Tax=Escallonia herrerae TaxID=1293975 RepID=A0AA88VIH2_9ASTE|nr:hypothetical protein RJ639_014688 [Escallonia herrerae]
MKGSIMNAISGAIPDSDNAKMYLAHIEEQFQGSSKAHATTLITKIVKLKYSGSKGVREHILWMNDMASQLKGLDMKISEECGIVALYTMPGTPLPNGVAERQSRILMDMVSASLHHIEDYDAPEVVSNDVPPIMDPIPIPANEKPLRSILEANDKESC